MNRTPNPSQVSLCSSRNSKSHTMGVSRARQWMVASGKSQWYVDKVEWNSPIKGRKTRLLPSVVYTVGVRSLREGEGAVPSQLCLMRLQPRCWYPPRCPVFPNPGCSRRSARSLSQKRSVRFGTQLAVPSSWQPVWKGFISLALRFPKLGRR